MRSRLAALVPTNVIDGSRLWLEACLSRVGGGDEAAFALLGVANVDADDAVHVCSPVCLLLSGAQTEAFHSYRA
jgi:hypothetical protein